MRSLVFEGNTWAVYEPLRANDKNATGLFVDYYNKCCALTLLPD